MTSEDIHKLLVSYQQLFWPNFIEHDGCVFLAFDEGAYKKWFQQLMGNKKKIEMAMNHRHIVDLLPAVVKLPTRTLVIAFGKLLKDMWETKLQHDFPEKKIHISFPSEHYEDLSDYEIVFYQESTCTVSKIAKK